MASTHTSSSHLGRPGGWLLRLGLLLALGPVAAMAAAPQDGTQLHGQPMQEPKQEAVPLLQAIQPQAAKSASRTLSGHGCQVDQAAPSPGPRPGIASSATAGARAHPGNQGHQSHQGCAPARKGPASTLDGPSSASPQSRSVGSFEGGLQPLALLERTASARLPPTATAVASGAYGRSHMLGPNLPAAVADGQVLATGQAASEPVGIPTLSQAGLLLLTSLLGVASMRMPRKRG